MSLILVLNQIVNDQIKEKNLDVNALNEYCEKHNIHLPDLFFKEYTIDGGESQSLIDIMIIQMEAEKFNYFYQLDEYTDMEVHTLLQLNVGESWDCYGMMAEFIRTK